MDWLFFSCLVCLHHIWNSKKNLGPLFVCTITFFLMISLLFNGHNLFRLKQGKVIHVIFFCFFPSSLFGFLIINTINIKQTSRRNALNSSGNMLIFHFFFLVVASFIPILQKSGRRSGSKGEKSKFDFHLQLSLSLVIRSLAYQPPMLAIFSNNLFVIYLIFDIYLSLLSSAGYHPPMLAICFFFSSSNNIFLSFILLFNICLSLCLSCHLQATTLPCWQYLFISQTFWRQTDFLLLHHPSLSP